jgi:hypothetical protein
MSRFDDRQATDLRLPFADHLSSDPRKRTVIGSILLVIGRSPIKFLA